VESEPLRPDELASTLSALHEESWGWALSCCRWDEPMAEDVLQTAYVRVISGKARFEGRSAFRTWFFGVIRRVSQEHGRRRRNRESRTRELELVPELESPRVGEPVDAVVAAETGRVLQAALEQLPDRQKEVLHLVFYEGLSVSEAAEVMGVSVGSARTHYARGKDRMRELLSEEALS
jgi:RNA polymerase sigma-70 factor (ECF subfamily)